MAQKLVHREQRIAFEQLLEGIRQESERIERLEKAIREAVPEWSLAEVVAAMLISLRLWECSPRSVISPAFKIRAS